MNAATCIFCRMLTGEIRAHIITENDAGIVIKDINPKADIHWLVIPRKHFADMRELTSEDERLLGALFMLGASAIRDYANNVPFRTVVNNGAEVGQHVFHSHIHILGGTIHDYHEKAAL